MCVKKSLSIVALIIVTQCWSTSCSGGYVTQNGIFENGHKELKESLIGSWRIMNPDASLVGEQVYEFCKNSRNIQLKVNGVIRKMERFDSTHGLSFTFEYLNDVMERVYVVGQFKSYARNVLLIVEGHGSININSLQSQVMLEKGMGSTESVVVSNGN